MKTNDAVIVCLSKISVVKEGYVQKEIKYAREIQKEKPDGTIFLIPLRLEECEIPFSLQDVQWGEYFESDGFEKLVKALNQRATQLNCILGVFTAPGHQGLPPDSYIPFPRNAIFTGREEDLKKLSALCEPGSSNIVISQAVTGMGGIGKTQLAVEFAYRYGHLFKGVHWLDLRNPETLDASIALCGKYMGLAYKKQPKQVAQTLLTWQNDGPHLLILDNFEDVTKTGSVLSRFQHPSLRLLITSRRKDFPKTADLQTQELNTFSETESSEFLERTLDLKETEEARKALAEKLGYLPLALELATSYININSLETSEYLNEIEDILSHESMQAEWFKGLDITNPTEHDQSLLATFKLSWQEVKDEIARKIFCLAAQFPQNIPIPLVILRKALEIDGKTALKSVHRLKMLNLLMSSDDAIVVHPLLASFAKLVTEDVFHDDYKKTLRYIRSYVLSLIYVLPLDSTISAPTVREVGGPLTQMVIRKDQDWQIDVSWEVHGSLLSKPTTASFPFTGDWIVRAYLESIGPGEEYTIPKDGLKLSVNASKTEVRDPKVSTDDRREYTATIKIGKDDVAAGVYKLVVAVNHESSPGVPGPIAGFYESGMLQIYEPT